MQKIYIGFLRGPAEAEPPSDYFIRFHLMKMDGISGYKEF